MFFHFISYTHVRILCFHFIQECDVVWSRNTIYLLIYTLQTLFCHIFDIYIWHVLSYHHWNIKTPYFHFIQECDVVWNGNTHIYSHLYYPTNFNLSHIWYIYIYIYIYIHLTCVKLQIMEHKMHFLPMSTLLSFLYLWLSGIRPKKKKKKKRRSIK